jgi:hypothetical protein
MKALSGFWIVLAMAGIICSNGCGDDDDDGDEITVRPPVIQYVPPTPLAPEVTVNAAEQPVDCHCECDTTCDCQFDPEEVCPPAPVCPDDDSTADDDTTLDDDDATTEVVSSSLSASLTFGEEIVQLECNSETATPALASSDADGGVAIHCAYASTTYPLASAALVIIQPVAGIFDLTPQTPLAGDTLFSFTITGLGAVTYSLDGPGFESWHAELDDSVTDTLTGSFTASWSDQIEKPAASISGTFSI